MFSLAIESGYSHIFRDLCKKFYRVNNLLEPNISFKNMRATENLITRRRYANADLFHGSF